MQKNVIANDKQDTKQNNDVYYIPIFYTNDWKKRYITIDDEIVEVEPKFNLIKKFKTWIGAKSFGFRKWKSSDLKGYIIKEVIRPMSDELLL